MKYLLVILFTVSSLATSAQVFETMMRDTTYLKTINSIRTSELKDSVPDGMWFVYERPSGRFEKLPKEQRIISTGQILNSKKVGVWKEFRPPVKDSTWQLITYENGVRHGLCQNYEKGKLQESYFCYKGKTNGIATSFHFSGTIRSVEKYDFGELREWTKYFSDGTVEASGLGGYCKRQGVLVVNYPSGQVKERCVFHDGELLLLQNWYENGQIKRIGYGGTSDYDAGNRVVTFGNCNPPSIRKGIWRIYDQQGKLTTGEYDLRGKLVKTIDVKE
jgi:antitoxin component YwqK of YwqJK toxin-antitoxin module